MLSGHLIRSARPIRVHRLRQRGLAQATTMRGNTRRVMGLPYCSPFTGPKAGGALR